MSDFTRWLSFIEYSTWHTDKTPEEVRKDPGKHGEHTDAPVKIVKLKK